MGAGAAIGMNCGGRGMGPRMREDSGGVEGLLGEVADVQGGEG